MNLEFSYNIKVKIFALVYITISSRPFVKFHYPLTERLSGYSYQQGVCTSVRPSVEALFVHTLFLSKVQSFTLKFIRPYIMKTL